MQKVSVVDTADDVAFVLLPVDRCSLLVFANAGLYSSRPQCGDAHLHWRFNSKIKAFRGHRPTQQRTAATGVYSMKGGDLPQGKAPPFF